MACQCGGPVVSEHDREHDLIWRTLETQGRVLEGHTEKLTGIAVIDTKLEKLMDDVKEWRMSKRWIIAQVIATFTLLVSVAGVYVSKG